MTELWRLPATRLAALVRRREISARDVALDALARLDRVNPRINAVVDHRLDEVLAEAGALDARLARGEDPGALAGVPVTVKVNVDQRGFATTNGTRLQRDLVAETSSPVVDNLRRAGAVVLGRTNAPAFSLRWFTANRLHGATRNPRDHRRRRSHGVMSAKADRALTPGGSSGGAAAAVAAGIGALAHGTDIAGSIRYPAYACGVHGLRPTHGRVAAYNASSPERPIGPQLMAVSGPLGRTIADLRAGLAALAAPDPRDPWWVPAPLEGPPAPRRVALCLRPGGLAIAPEVEAALLDAARRLRDAGWTVEEIEDTPPMREAADLTARLWLAEGFPALAEQAEREGDPGALAVVAHCRAFAEGLGPDAVAQALLRRATLVRQWLLFLERTPVLLLPVSAELPFPDGLDMQGEAAFRRVWEAQLTQLGLPLLGLPALAVATGLAGTAPVGVQVVAGRYREDLCLLAGEAIEAGGTPPLPTDPA